MRYGGLKEQLIPNHVALRNPPASVLCSTLRSGSALVTLSSHDIEWKLRDVVQRTLTQNAIFRSQH